MYLYCGSHHPLYETSEATARAIKDSKYVGIGYHSPNMEVTQQLDQQRDATAYDQEAVAHLILSGKYLGYLPEHYAAAFVSKGDMSALLPDEFQYVCHFSAIVRRSPPPSRVVQTLLNALVSEHDSAAEV